MVSTEQLWATTSYQSLLLHKEIDHLNTLAEQLAASLFIIFYIKPEFVIIQTMIFSFGCNVKFPSDLKLFDNVKKKLGLSEGCPFSRRVFHENSPKKFCIIYGKTSVL